MTYRISVYQSDKLLMPWWINFLKTYGLLNRSENPINKPLAKWNGKDIPNSHYIEFASEADATLFLLRFS